MSDNVDPFAGGDSHPSISWDGAQVGKTVTGTIAEPPTLVQGKDFDTGKPATWDDGNPKMVVAINIEGQDGETRTLWAPKPSALFKAIKDAGQESGGILKGGVLSVKFTGKAPVPNKPQFKMNTFAVKYMAPGPVDAFGGDSPDL